MAGRDVRYLEHMRTKGRLLLPRAPAEPSDLAQSPPHSRRTVISGGRRREPQFEALSANVMELRPYRCRGACR